MMPAFHDAAAIREWKTYFAEVDRLLARVGDVGPGLCDDLQSHLAESYATGDPQESETVRLQSAIGRLGRPADYLRPLLADELLDRGTRSYSPAPIAQGLYHNIRAGSSRAVLGAAFGFGYLLLAAFTAMAVMKPVWGEHVGLFRRPDGSVNFGIIADTAGSHELLGLWIIPIALATAGLLYVILTRSLRAVRRR